MDSTKEDLFVVPTLRNISKVTEERSSTGETNPEQADSRMDDENDEDKVMEMRSYHSTPSFALRPRLSSSVESFTQKIRQIPQSTVLKNFPLRVSLSEYQAQMASLDNSEDEDETTTKDENIDKKQSSPTLEDSEPESPVLVTADLIKNFKLASTAPSTSAMKNEPVSEPIRIKTAQDAINFVTPCCPTKKKALSLTNQPRIPLQTLQTPDIIPPSAKKESPKKRNENRAFKSKSQSFDKITINGKEYPLLSLLGKGGSSKVYQAYEVETQRLLAIKCVSLDNTDEDVAEAYKNEIALLKRLQYSDRVITLYDYECCKTRNCLLVVMEKGDTDLAMVIRSYAKNNNITAPMIKFYWSEMLKTVQVIHKVGIIHSDLKPANFLLVSGRMKLIDFGIASSLQSDMTSIIKDVQMGTFNYMSPEAIKDSAHEYDSNGKRCPRIKIGVKSDVWSLGCILYNLVYGKTPFQHLTSIYAKSNAITNPKYIIDFPDIADKELLDVMKKSLIRDPKLRPSIDELLEHPYLQDNLKNVENSVQPEEPTIQEVSASSVLKQLAALTPTSLRHVSQELKTLLNPTQIPSGNP